MVSQHLSPAIVEGAWGLEGLCRQDLHGFSVETYDVMLSGDAMCWSWGEIKRSLTFF